MSRSVLRPVPSGFLALALLSLPACGSSNDESSSHGASKIKHVVLIAQENHTFDSYFGKYCTAAAGSNPSCTTGKDCCEAAPATEPGGASAKLLDDASNLAVDRNHAAACELAQIDGGKMDHFVTGSGVTPGAFDPPCSAPENFALAEQATMATYWDYADRYALADRYFQPVIGSTSSNDMYLAIARWQFADNDDRPKSAGSGCVSPFGTAVQFTDRKTVADLLIEKGETFAVYADGYAETVAAAPSCPDPPSDCPFLADPIASRSCRYDPSDVPFEYYAQFTDDKNTMNDVTQFATDIAGGNLPSFAYVKERTYRNEHPKYSSITGGAKLVKELVDLIQGSDYEKDTLILLTWDEGGGFFDHLAPPPAVPTANDADDKGNPVSYGTRVPTLAVGRFALTGVVSHVEMEHSSIVRFLEWNFLGADQAGALGNRDAVVNNIGSLLDPKKTGLAVPAEN